MQVIVRLASFLPEVWLFCSRERCEARLDNIYSFHLHRDLHRTCTLAQILIDYIMAEQALLRLYAFTTPHVLLNDVKEYLSAPSLCFPPPPPLNYSISMFEFSGCCGLFPNDSINIHFGTLFWMSECFYWIFWIEKYIRN